MSTAGDGRVHALKLSMMLHLRVDPLNNEPIISNKSDRRLVATSFNGKDGHGGRIIRLGGGYLLRTELFC